MILTSFTAFHDISMHVAKFKFILIFCFLILFKRASKNKLKQAYIRWSWEVLTLPQHSYSRYGCDVFVCAMINALIEPRTELIDQRFFFPTVGNEWFLHTKTRHTVCPLTALDCLTFDALFFSLRKWFFWGGRSSLFSSGRYLFLNHTCISR